MTYSSKNLVPTPYYLIDEGKLIENLELLKRVKEEAGCKILLAQKAFSSFAFYPLMEQYLDGTTSSGLFEAKLAHEEFKGENHVFSPAYTDQDMEELMELTDHFVFNSMSQLRKYLPKLKEARKSVGVRVNPEHSTQGGGMYDPCAVGSRLGVPFHKLDLELVKELDGLHFHTLCEQNVEPLIETIQAFEEKFGAFIGNLKWVNFGGGHHITRADYGVEKLIDTVKSFQAKYDVEVYLEPGEAVVYQAGTFVTKVIDVLDYDIPVAILDASATCHMPDVLEVPYRPSCIGESDSNKESFTYRLGGPSCLAGDIIGDYSFKDSLKPGDLLEFEDMALYTIVKNNTFNGIPLPSICVLRQDGTIQLIKSFSYQDFKSRLS